ncbi:MAG TPA: hypothetical protein VFQ25_13735 [Ktedonobacterales bacterium]|nr:hypothetical protein [Ktedonobacterales bacterium]
MSKTVHRRTHDIFSLAGWLFADLLLVLTLVFLVSAAPWQQVNPPPPPPLICGVEQHYQKVFVSTSDPSGLISHTSRGVRTFQNGLRNKLGPAKGKVAGLVEVFGGGSVTHGVALATGAIGAMKQMRTSGYIFTSKTAYFRPLWNGQLSDNTVEVDVFYLILATSCKS